MRESAATMLDPLPIPPFTRPARGLVELPGSKSITNRALLLAALCDRPVTVANALFSEDTEIMTRGLLALGIKVVADAGKKLIRVFGRGGKIPADDAEIFVGNAGTAARFLTALCVAASRGVFRIDGVPQMRRRPMKGLIDALRALGAKITCRESEGFFPITIEANGLKGGTVSVDARESSQMFSALLMVAPLAEKSLVLQMVEGDTPSPFVAMTMDLMGQFGHGPIIGGRMISVPKERYAYRLPSDDFRVESDATAASYFIVLPVVVGGTTTIGDYRLALHPGFQGDTRFAHILQQRELISGFDYQSAVHQVGAGRKRTGIDEDFSSFSDTFLTLAAIAPLLEGPTRITGIGHTRKQETDRVAGAARELRKLGQEVVEEPDALTITPRLDELRRRAGQGGVEIETYNDHRFAMSFAILGCRDLLGEGQPWLRIRNPGCCAKTFPDFFSVLDGVWLQSHSQP